MLCLNVTCCAISTSNRLECTHTKITSYNIDYVHGEVYHNVVTHMMFSYILNFSTEERALMSWCYEMMHNLWRLKNSSLNLWFSTSRGLSGGSGALDVGSISCCWRNWKAKMHSAGNEAVILDFPRNKSLGWLACLVFLEPTWVKTAASAID